MPWRQKEADVGGLKDGKRSIHKNEAVGFPKRGGQTDIRPLDWECRLELAGGTLRFPPAIQYSTEPGLWQGTLPTNGIVNASTASQANSAMAPYMDKTYPTYTNEVSWGADLFRVHTYPPWEDYLTATWSGYLWNRSPTNETWSFAVNFGGYMRFWIDNGATLKITTDDNQGMAISNKVITPGAHPIVLKANPRGYNIAGSLSKSSIKHYNMNGDFRIKETWRLRSEYLTPADGTLTVYGKLKFDAGVALECEDLSLLPRSREYVIARATDGI